MGKTKLPSVAFKIKTEDFMYLTRALRDEMNGLIATIEDSDLHEQSLFEHNYWLIKSWIVQCEAESSTVTIKTDLMYAKAFVEYFKVIDLPDPFENMLLCRVIGDFDAGINSIENKRRNRQL